MPNSPVPQHCPTQRELDDLELLVSGAFAPTTAFNEPGSPVTLSLPPEIADSDVVELTDPEGLPLARVSTGTGQIESLTHAQYGPFRRLHLTPAQTRERYAGRMFVPVADPLTSDQLDRLREAGPAVLLALMGAGTPSLSPVGLLRATLAAAEGLNAEVVAVPLASHGDPYTDHALGLRVVDNYAGPDPVLAISDDSRAADESSHAETYPPAIQAIIDHDRPPLDEQGLVLFFTGLSGSGKSTLARALMDRILEQGERTVTSLDGDVVRRNLSAGLTFSKEDRETNIRRIGWVAAEISRHGGIAVCSPIAPFDDTRQQVREMVEQAGGAFFLVHVATPLEECERRDRKGLYAKARRGEIPEFTGISSPYEEPDDAAVRVDTTGRSIDEALGDVTDALARAGYLELTAPGTPDDATPESTEVTSSEPGRPLQVLFVCTANICRSPFMEHVARQIAGEDADIVFSSAGTHGFVDSPVDDEIAATLKLRELDPSAFRSRPLTPELLEGSDLVLTAEAAHRNFILADHPELFRKVFTLGQFVEALEKVDGAGLSREELLDRLGQSRGAADAGLDVADPYRRGPEAAETAATRIEELLRVVVPALTRSRKITS